jgi:hypothetical protein
MLKTLQRGLVAAVLFLTACSATTTAPTTTTTAPNTLSTLATIAASPVGQSLITAVLDTAVPQLNTIVAKGSAASSADLQQVAYWAPWINALVTTFGAADPSVNVSGITSAVSAVQTAASAASTVQTTANAVALLGTALTQLQPLAAEIMAAK